MPVSLAPAWAEHDKLAKSLPRNVRESLGVAFTPRALALRLAHDTLGKFPKQQCPQILDPACGLGALLLAALEWATVQRPLWVGPMLAGRMQGWEVGRELSDGARKVLALAGKCLNAPCKVKLHTTDSLMSDEQEIADAILLCPPFRELRGAESQSLPPDKRAWFARRFGSFASLPSFHGAFAELAGRLVKRQAGRVGMLLPFKVADQPDYGGLRRALANLLALESLSQAPIGAIAGVSDELGQFVFLAGKGDISGEPWKSRQDEQEQVYQSSIMRHAPLPPGIFCDIGINPGNSAHLLLTDKPEPGAMPIRDASDVIAFGVRNPRMLLRGKVPRVTGFYAKISPPSVFKQVKILIQRDGSRVIAAKHHPPAFFRDDLIGCLGSPAFDDDYLLGVFNSEYFARLYRDSFREGRLRAQGKITIEQLNSLPVPSRRAAGASYDALIQVSRELQKVAGREPKLRAHLETLVRKAYGV